MLSLPLYSKLDFFSSRLSLPLLISTFLLRWTLLIVSNPIPPSLMASISPSAPPPHCIFVFFLLSLPLLLPFFLFSFTTIAPSPPSLCFLLSMSFFFLSLSVLYSQLSLHISSLLALFCFSSALRPLTLYFCSPPPFPLILQPLSPSLWVSGLCGGFQHPSYTSNMRKSWKASCGTRPGQEKKGGIDVRDKYKKWRKKKGKRFMEVVSVQELDVNMLTGRSQVVQAGFE